jgi:hypothetical protein
MPLPRGKDSGRITDKQEVIRELRSDGPPMPGRRYVNLRISQLRRRRTTILQSLSRRAMVGINYPPVLNEIPSLLFPLGQQIRGFACHPHYCVQNLVTRLGRSAMTSVPFVTITLRAAQLLRRQNWHQDAVSVRRQR